MPSTKHHTSTRATALGGLASIAAFGGAAAQSPDAAESAGTPQGVISEVLVTATKRGESSVMDVPITIQAMSSEALESRGATEFNDFVRLVPGLSLSDQGAGNKRYVLRGVSSTGAGTVGVYLDEIVITGENSQTGGGLQSDPKMFDVQRVEVLKGPQGTTFGSSALSGVVRYILNKPDLNAFEGSARASLNSQKYADVGGNADVTVNLPIIDDRFAVRASAFYQDRPGYISNRYENDYNDEETWAARLQGRVKLTDNAMLDLHFMRQETEAGLNYYNLTDMSRTPIPRYFQATPERQGFDDDQNLYNATLNYELGFGTVTATASRVERTLVFNRPASEVLAAAARIPNADTDGLRSVLTNPRERETTSYEVRFASDWDAAVQLLTGVYYQKEERDFASKIYTINSDGYIDASVALPQYGPVLQNRSLWTQIKEEAIFAEATWDVTDRFQLVTGIRAFRFENASQGNVTTGVLGRPGNGLGPYSTSKEESAIGRVIASFDLNDDSMIYAQVAQGYRPGGTNDQAAAALGGASDPDGYNSDDLMNYEVGLKHTSADRLVSVTMAAFYIDWSDIQVQLTTVPIPPSVTNYAYTGNAGSARVYGLEIESQLHPISGLDLGLAASYNNATIRETVPGGAVRGDRIPYSPEYSVTASGDYRFPLAQWEGFVGGDVNWISDQPTNFPAAGSYYPIIDENTTVNVRTGVQFGDWRTALIVRNLLDDDTVQDLFFQQQPQTLLGYYRKMPRTVSLEFSTKF